MNQLFMFSVHSGDNSTVTPPLPIALDAGISSFRQRGAFVKDKVHEGCVLIRVWQELEYRLDVCRVINRAYIEDLWACSINFLVVPLAYPEGCLVGSNPPRNYSEF
jgi:hypothetical protein